MHNCRKIKYALQTCQPAADQQPSPVTKSAFLSATSHSARSHSRFRVQQCCHCSKDSHKAEQEYEQYCQHTTRYETLHHHMRLSKESTICGTEAVRAAHSSSGQTAQECTAVMQLAVSGPLSLGQKQRSPTGPLHAHKCTVAMQRWWVAEQVGDGALIGRECRQGGLFT